MPLSELTIEHLRCIAAAEVEFSASSNLIEGANGSGKTSLLEAVFLLGRGRSFRTRTTERLIATGEPLLRVTGRSQDPVAAREHRLGVEISRATGARARLDAQDVRSLADLALALPVQIIDPDIHKLVEEGSQRRRRWLDWLVFHVEPSFAGAWTRYSRLLKQRNAALRQEGSDLDAWNVGLAREGEALALARAAAIERLQPSWAAVSEDIAGIPLAISFERGWDREVSLQAALERAAPRDRLRQTTTVGAHRADVTLRSKGRLARDQLSRGQQKLAAVSLVLSQLELLKADLGLRPTLLLDDPAAELDSAHLGRFISRVSSLETQLIVTALDSNHRVFGEPEAVFHVEQGRVKRV
jgi:DNA replication and repair protein RecF